MEKTRGEGGQGKAQSRRGKGWPAEQSARGAGGMDRLTLKEGWMFPSL